MAERPGLADLSPAEHEALCRRCGMSCHFAIPVNGLAVVVDELRCKFLVRDPGEAGRYSCSVYERRFELAPWCHTAQDALAGGFLAQDCPYARGVPGYRGKVRLSPGLLQKVLPAIRAEVARAGAPIGADPDAVAELLAAGGSRWEYGVSADGTRYQFTPPAAPAAAEPATAPPAAAESATAPPQPPASPARSPKLRVL